MWQPDPGWEPLRAGRGITTAGVWRADVGDAAWVVKRLVRPDPLTGGTDLADLLDPTSDAWWRREADVAASRLVAATPGLRSPAPGAVEEDEDGVTLWFAPVQPAPTPAADVAAALGAFAAADVGEQDWLAHGVLRRRIRRAEAHGGWQWLAALGDLPGRLWQARSATLAALDGDGTPSVPAHGDPVPDNLLAASGADAVVAVDWGLLGRAPVGSDLGYFWLSVGGDLTGLARGYARALGVDRLAPVLRGARAAAAFTVCSRAEWALERALGGPPPSDVDQVVRERVETVARHPSVARSLRAARRVSWEIRALLDDVDA